MVSAEHGLNYVNPKTKEHLTIANIKASILAHRQATGVWPIADSTGPVEHGPYRGQETWKAIDAALRGNKAADGTTIHIRGLPGGSSLPDLNAMISAQHGLDYVNPKTKQHLTIENIKTSILAHRRATGIWPIARSTGPVEYGPYRGQETWRAIDAALKGNKAPDGTTIPLRGLPGGSSLADLNAMVSTEHSLDYVNPKTKQHLTIENIKASILAHRQATGVWPTARSHPNTVEYGPYRGQETWIAIDAALRGKKAPGGTIKPIRGLPGGSSLTKLVHEISTQPDLPQFKRPQHTTYRPSF